MAALLDRLLLPALNHLVHGEAWAQERLLAHSGAHIAIEAGPVLLRLQIDDRGLFRAADEIHVADVTLTLPSDAPLRLLFDRDAVFSSVRLAGTADVAESLAFVFRNLRWDVEDDLAKLVGDIAAHRIVRAGRALGSGLSDALRRMAENAAEFTTEESGLLPPGREVVAFADAIQLLTDDLNRLEHRITALSR